MKPESGLINDNRQTSFQFEANKTYRLRLINMSGIAAFRVYLEDHAMEIVELDGVCISCSIEKPMTQLNVYRSLLNLPSDPVSIYLLVSVSLS